MKISLIIPVYNEAPFLRRCLASVPVSADVETIIVDDGSTDGSADIIREYEENTRHGIQITAKYHDTNWGVSMARNHALSAAQGDYISFLDADDELAPGAIPAMLSAAERADKTGDVITMFNHMRCYGNAAPVPKFTNRRGYYDLRNTPAKWTTVWGKLIRRDFITENGIRFRSGIQYGEDEIFLLECLRLCRRFYHNEAAAILKHYDNPNSLTKTLTKKKVNDFMRAEMELIEQDNPPDFDAALRQIIADHWNASAFVGIYGK